MCNRKVVPDFDWLVLVGLHIEGKRRMSFLCGDTPQRKEQVESLFLLVSMILHVALHMESHSRMHYRGLGVVTSVQILG